MNIANYISDLLYRYECVILPDFGAILSNRKPAQIHKSSHVFEPPKKELSFNKSLIQNDGLLTNYISKAQGISYDAAAEKVEEYLHFLKLEIEEGRTVTLEKIGNFYLSAENKIIFEPNQDVNYLAEAFGLSSFTSKTVGRDYTGSKETELPVHQKTSSAPYLKYAAVGLLAIGIAGFGGFQLYKKDVTAHNIAAQQKAAKQIEQEIQQATFLIENPLPTIQLKVATKPKGIYHIVAGAFRIRENAAEKVEELKSLGYKAREIGANKYGLHQVIYNSYTTRAEALKDLKIIQNQVNSGAWLLIQKLQ